MKSPYLDVALQATQAAEEVLLKYFGKNIAFQTKPDLSPVTIADQEAEEIIKTCIKDKFPDHTFFGEEGEKADLRDHKGYTWIIDPIDGTKSYMRGNPLFATQLALLRDGELVIGVSNAPAMHELMYAEKGQGCFLNGEPVAVAKTVNLGEAYASFGAIKYFNEHRSLDALIRLSESVKVARSIGDFWPYHLLAQGKLEIVLEAETKLWDVAALKVIVEEAGGAFTQIDGLPVGVNTTSTLATNGSLHQSVLNIFKD